MKNRYFPLFVSSEGKEVLVIGGGKIAERRIGTLTEFDFQITVVSPALTEKLADLAETGRIVWIADSYDKKYMKDCFMVLVCTCDRKVNRRAGLDAKEKEIPVSVCDRKEECTFYFPAVAAGEEVTAGIAGTGNDHGAVRRAAAKVREIIKGKAY